MRRPLAVLAVLLISVAAAGCAAPAPPGAPAAAVALPWPARSAAEAAGLQAAADGGTQPWLLDPAEVALAYVAAVHGWTTAATDAPAPGRVVVTGPGGATRTLTVVQPTRSGATGIWTVTSDT